MVTAEAETGCPRPPGRFPCWRPCDASGGSGAPEPGKPRLQPCHPLRTRLGGSAPREHRIRPWRRSAYSLSHLPARTRMQGTAGLPGFGALAAIVFPFCGTLNTAPGGASLPGRTSRSLFPGACALAACSAPDQALVLAATQRRRREGSPKPSAIPNPITGPHRGLGDRWFYLAG